MVGAIFVLLSCQLAGELVREAAHLAVPGPVIGMFLLAAILVIRSGDSAASVPVALSNVADRLIGAMGLLFVPAGVGIIAEAHLLREAWIPIVAAVVGSTLASLAVTGVIMHLAIRPAKPLQPAAEPRLKHV